MTPARFQQARDVFHQACDLDVAERAAYLKRACADDAALRTEVESLLARDGDGEGPLGASDAPLGQRLLADAPTRRIDAPGQIGPYKLIREIGVGGMGVVYLAEQDGPRRRVALKVIKPGVVTPSTLRRFEHETQVLGMLQHPGIAQIFEAGIADTRHPGAPGQPFFAMELVNGRPLTDYASVERLSTGQRLALFAGVCDAVHHAHQKGVIHRDLKPTNILVDEAGQPKILDFGVARAVDTDVQVTTVRTDIGQLIGTLQYMSPEQVDGDSRALDTRSDVYSLGVVLYELLSGQLPYDVPRSSLARAVQIVREQTPRRLSTIDRAFRGEVETITLKALEKDRDRRYQSAAELAQDLRRYLDNEPIAAKPPTLRYQLRKLVARHKGVSVLAALLFLSLGAFGAGMTILYTKAEANRLRAVDAEQTAQAEAKTAQQVSESLIKMMEGLDPFLGSGLDELIGGAHTPEQVLEQAAETIAEQLEDQPAIQAKLRMTLGGVDAHLGRYDRAEELYRMVLDLQRSQLGDEHANVAETLYRLANVLWAKGDFAEVEALYRESIAIRRRLFGDDSPEVAFTLADLARQLYAIGADALAEPLLDEAVGIMRRGSGDRDERRADVLTYVAGALPNSGDYVTADALLHEALALYRELLSEGAPQVSFTKMNPARVLRHKGDLEAAEALYRETLEELRDLLGGEHPYVSYNLVELATTLRMRGNSEKAALLAHQALATQRRSLGDRNPHVATFLAVLAGIQRDEGDYEAAERYSRESLSIRRKLFDEKHPSVIGGLLALASVLKATGDLTGAEALLREALASRRKLLGDEHPQVGDILVQLVTIVRAQGDYDDAEVLFQQVLVLRRKAYGDTHSTVAETLRYLAFAAQLRGDHEGAEALCREALATRRDLYGDEHLNVAEDLVAVARLLHKKGDFAEAEA